ncbi:putative protein isoform X4 [Capsicum chacoense]
MWINPTFEKANSLQNWASLKKKHTDITMLPSLQIKLAQELKIGAIARSSFDYNEVKYCKFTAKIASFLNANEPYYASCNNCYKKVNFIGTIPTCSDCRGEKLLYEDRFRLILDVFANNEHCTVTLFEATKYLTGCNITTYKQSISEKKNPPLS